MEFQTNGAVTLAGFVTSFVLEGSQRCSGIFFSWILDQSEDSRQKAAVPFVDRTLETSLQCGVFLGILGAALSFISSDLIWLTICWGIIFGSGIGISSPEPLKVSQKFRTQPFLLLICCAAPSFACILVPYFLQFLLSCYGLCGCLLIVSGITLNAAPFIMVASYRIRFQLRKPLWRIRKKYEINDVEKNSGPKKSSGSNSDGGIDNECFEIESTSMSDQSEEPTISLGNNTISSIRKSIIPKNSILFPIKELNTDSDNQIIPTSRKNTETLAKDGNNAAFEKDFSEEDVLFELTSNVSSNGIRQSCTKSGFGYEISDTTNDNRIISCRSRKNTIINSLPKSSVISLPKEVDATLHQDELSAKNLSNSISIDSGRIQPKNSIRILRNKLNDPPTIHTCPRNALILKPPSNITSNSFPLEIKVHVVECSFTEDDVRDGRLLTQSVPNTKRGGDYRRHSNSLITSQYNNINFCSPNFSKHYNKPSNFRSSNPSPNMYLISEDDELTIDSPNRRNDAISAAAAIGQRRKHPMLSSLKKILKPTCLVVIYAFVIHEVTLVTLLTIFDDHIDGLVTPATAVLPAFGLGGILGRLSVRFWGDRLLLEGSHATAALLFILDGVVVAGILWSPNIYWIGGFYAAIGFLEIGISTAVWNLVSDHIEIEVKSALFATCKLLCGICSLFVPYIIGLSRDVMGDYDDLLQITSGLSVLCALLCYILPKFTFHIKHMRGS